MSTTITARDTFWNYVQAAWFDGAINLREFWPTYDRMRGHRQQGAETMGYEPEYLNRWTRPQDYFGNTWEHHFSSGCGRSRDSDALKRANFRAMLNALGFDESENVADDCPLDSGDEPARLIVRENHWAVGWVEWIAIHESDTAGLKIADEIAEARAEYPVIDEELWSEYENADCEETWANCFDPKERAEYLRKHIGSPVGLFRKLRAAVKGDWYEAGNLLPCPSDLLY